MGIWGAFTNSTTAMIAQNNALNTISQNLTNANTTGYKRTDTLFATMLSQTQGFGQDIFGVRSGAVTRISSPGQIAATTNPYDLAIRGEGFFVLNTMVDGRGETMFSRDGSFLKEAVDGGAYLVDRNGYFLQGWAVSPDGAVNTSSLTAIEIPETTVADGIATTEVTLSANIPAGAGSPQAMAVGIYDGDFAERNLSMTWTPAGANAWSVSCTVDGGTVTSPAIDVAFDGQGKIVSPLASDLTIAWDAGGASTISLDLSATTQFAGTLTSSSEQDGLPRGTLLSTAFNGSGTLVGEFSNGRTLSLFQLPLARFRAPDALETRAGNVFASTEAAGDYEFFAATGDSTFAPSALEASNVDMTEEFTRMILTQKAYSSAATVFRTVDEMTVLLRDLKR